MNENVLDQLAELCGIEPGYHDIWARTHKVSEKTKLDLFDAVGRQSMELGLKVGLYEDLAVGVDSAGAETWVHQDLYALGVRYMVAEKILADHERLREDWQVHGTTGYDFANLVGGLFANTQTEKEMDRIYYTEFVGNRLDFEELLYHCNKLIMRMALASELCGFDPKARPIGSGVWVDTRIDAPSEHVDKKVYRNIFTGECVVPEMHNGNRSFPVANLFSNFPVALLIDDRSKKSEFRK
jgi:hypothetical protein